MASPGSPPKTDPPADPEAGRIKSLDDRFGAIEAEQREQRGILGRIEAALTGGGKDPKAPPASPSSQGSPPESGLSVAEQVKRGVEEIEARKQQEAEAKAREDADKAWRASVDERLPERRPSEPATGRKTKLQERLFGKPGAR